MQDSKNLIRIELPLGREQAASLRAGDRVTFSGALYTARDAAHKRLVELVKAGKPLPFPIEGAVIYYAGPTPARPGEVIGSAGPTTSGRMDAYAPALIALGLRGMIGKGGRSPEVAEAMTRYGAVYFGAIGGAGALLAGRVRASEVVAFGDLGTEAIRRLVVEDFPAVVAIDSRGGNYYELGREEYLRYLERNNHEVE
jgi:fumarate hydratase subunit beta